MESLSWQAPSFHYREKSASWYVWSIVIAVVVAIFALLQGNILFTFFVVIAEAIVLFLAKQKPPIYLYEATNDRVIVEKYREYPFNELEGFAIVDDPFSERFKELVMTPKKRLGTYIKILVPVERAQDLKTHLAQYLPEIEYEEPVSDSILKRLGL